MADIPAIKVTGKPVLVKSGNRYYWHNRFRWYADGKRQRSSASTGLPENSKTNTRNKKRAEEICAIETLKLETMLNLTIQYNEAQSVENKDSILKILFSSFIEYDWLEAVRRGDRKAVKKKVKLTTFGGYQTNVQKTIAPYFCKKGILLIDLTADDINAFYEFQYARGVSIKTVLNLHANIVSSLRYAARMGYINSADSILMNVYRPDAEDYVAKPYNEAEVMKLITAVKGHRLELGAIIGAFYGLRRSEIVGLRWESIDFDANTITIEHTVTEMYVDGKRVVIAGDSTKSKSSNRTLPLIPIMRAKLLEVKQEQERNQKLSGKSYNKKEGEYIYTDALGNRIKPNYISSTFPQFLVKNNLRRIRFHDLRHSCARLLLANGVSLKAIQEWLGHSTFKTTADIYARFDGSSNQDSAKALTWIENTSLAQDMLGAAQ